MIAAALAAAVGFGAADWLGGAATARAGSVRRVLLISEPVATLVLLAALVAAPGQLSAGAVLLGMAAGLAAGVGQACLYTALATGPAALAAPVCGIVSIAVPVAHAAATGDPLDPRQWAGAAVVAAAIVVLCGLGTRADPPLAAAVALLRRRPAGGDRPVGHTGPVPHRPGHPAREQPDRGPSAGAAQAVIDRHPPAAAPPPARPGGRGRSRELVLAATAGAGFGAYTIVLGHAPPGSSLWPVVLAHAALAAAVLGLILAAALRRPGAHRQPAHPRGPVAAPAGSRPGVADTKALVMGWAVGRMPAFGLAAALGVAEAVAAAATLLAARADIAVTAAIVAAHPAVTVLLARYLDRQTLGASRTAGLGLTCIGLLLLAG
ncbi:MAG: hypothetical protein AVDCRST_MAG41-4402 [uncultured Corynebacteriales bacterium]|uniref:EamA domain-containing protein n=1 Tax=uncultured Mycobacteriales bacterium TaxID=581187 RepID=A0A6J4JZ72_9ACTN|nr:MAG: hypothetical protein AVDCRST_MAG41-4402 [uncultured Corynebacteriales bacterium]